MRQILPDGVVILQFDRTDATQAAKHLRPSELDHALAEVRIARQVALRLGREILAAEAGQTVLDIGRVADLARLAVADNVDANRNLAGDDIGHRLAHLAVKIRVIVVLALILLDQQLDHRLRPRQTADMGRQNAIGAEFHGGSPGPYRRSLSEVSGRRDPRPMPAPTVSRQTATVTTHRALDWSAKACSNISTFWDRSGDR